MSLSTDVSAPDLPVDTGRPPEPMQPIAMPAADDVDAALPVQPPVAETGSREDMGSVAMPSPVCLQGAYTAELTCAVDGAGPIDVTGQFSLRPAGHEGKLDVVGSALRFVAPGFIATAELSGMLDCQTGVFAAAVNNVQFIWIVVPTIAPLTGEMSGQAATDQPVISGAWSFTTPGDVTCPGTWRAERAQP